MWVHSGRWGGGGGTSWSTLCWSLSGCVRLALDLISLCSQPVSHQMSQLLRPLQPRQGLGGVRVTVVLSLSRRLDLAAPCPRRGAHAPSSGQQRMVGTWEHNVDLSLKGMQSWQVQGWRRTHSAKPAEMFTCTRSPDRYSCSLPAINSL